MKKTKIIGRIEECNRLDDVLTAETAQLVIVYGRRRVGKTYLINQYFDNNFAFKLTGVYHQPKAVQLKNFALEVSRKTKKKNIELRDWYDAFELLREYIEGLSSDEKQIFFFDEMPWFDTYQSNFLPAFEWFWNDYASTKDNIVFIVCGSATSWMVEHISNNKGGLFNRQTCRLYLKPFTLSEVEEYLLSKGFMWSRYDIAECYMIMGGVPFYLSLLKKSLSLAQNVDILFFKEKGELWDEFEHLYATLFSNSEAYIKIVELLSSKKGGLTREQIIESSNFQSNGGLSKILKNLADAGFIRINTHYGNKKKDIRYQLSDYYTAFYLHFVKDKYGRDEQFWSHSIDNPAKRAWAGLTYEQLCKDHIAQIKKALGISGVLTEESVWSVKGGIDESGTEHQGAQIDLLIDRRDRVINICEIKFSSDEFEIDKAYDKSLRNKIERFVTITNCKKSIQLTFVTTYGVKTNMYSGSVGSQVTLDDLFKI